MLLSSLSIFGRTASIIACDKDVDDDGGQVLGQLVLVRSCVTVNHDPDARFRKEPFHELEGESTQSVPMGNHNRAEFATVSSLQKGEEVLPLEVEARADVGEDIQRVWIGRTQVGDLALKIGTLFVGTDSGITDRSSFTVGFFPLLRARHRVKF